ncbi:Metallopeptidase 2 [Ceratobasidium theobromae]|uniref:Metallopeptidase 2 n=1 Tax=Ceratobasidium theobromae TaxID=1582974 RepID=A0A5N5QAJ4_9AGAM|nr:Metallopeptidase 2 [Ceratobasidium theobromae]
MKISGLILALIQCAALCLGDTLTNLKVTIIVRSSTSQSIKVRVQIKNEGNQEYRVLQSPTSLIDPSENADKFNPAMKGSPDTEPEFLGRAYKWSPEEAAVQGKYTTFSSGATKIYDYELKEYYDFSRSGAGVYMLIPTPYILLLDANNNIESATYKTEPYAEITIRSTAWSTSCEKSMDPVNFSVGVDTPRAQLHNCDNACPGGRDCLRKIQLAADSTRGLARDAKDHLDRNYDRWSTRLTRWFGARSDNRARRLRRRVDSLAAEDFSRYTPVQYITTELFLRASHFRSVAKTKDYKYGVRRCERLAQNDPKRAIKNADSFQYYAENPA